MNGQTNLVLTEVLQGIVAHLKARIPIKSAALYSGSSGPPLAEVGDGTVVERVIELAPGLVAEAVIPAAGRHGDAAVRSFPVADRNGRMLGVFEVITETGLSEPQAELLTRMARRLSQTMRDQGLGA